MTERTSPAFTVTPTAGGGGEQGAADQSAQDRVQPEAAAIPAVVKHKGG